jgi:EamA domain-containing membrane protein RarD
MIKRNPHTGFIMIFCAGILWGTLGSFTTELTKLGAKVSTNAFLRMTFRMIFLIPVMLCFEGKNAFVITRKGLIIAILMGVIGQDLFNICYIESVELLGISKAAILLYLSPVFVTIMSKLFFKEKIFLIKWLVLFLDMKYVDYEYNVFIDKMDCDGLKDSGMCMCNQFRSVDRKYVIDKLGYVVDARLKEKIDLAVAKASGIAQ